MPRSYICYRAPHPVAIDGRIDKPEWTAAPWTSLFVDILGSDRPKPPLRTRVKMLWDDTYFYVAAELEDPHVWASITERDAVIFHDNDFELFIDPDGDNHQYYELEINALNTAWDLLLIKPYRDGGPAVNGWDIAGLVTAVHVNGTLNDPRDHDVGWSVELALPWKSLAECAHCACPPKSGDFWRVNFSRVQWETSVVDGKYVKTPGKPEDNWVWSPQGAVDMHRPEKWGCVWFSTDTPQSDLSASHRQNHAETAREFLMSIYYEQKAFFERHGRYAGAHELAVKRPGKANNLADTLVMETMAGAFCASVQISVNGKLEQWSVREDSRLWNSTNARKTQS